MFKKIKLLTLVITFNCVSAIASNSICSRQGAITICGSGELHDLHVAGKAILTGTHVLDFTKVAGMLIANRVSLNNLKVSGLARFNQSIVSGDAVLSGLLCASHSEFNQLTISSDKVNFDNVLAKQVRIDPGGNKQVFCLLDKSIIKGDIVFSSGHGMVVMDDSSRVLGQVSGGIIKQNQTKEYCGEVSC